MSIRAPWTGLAMHPVEQILFYSSVLIYYIVPAHQLIVIFEGIVLGSNTSVTTHDHFHYLHHKYFECNYGLGHSFHSTSGLGLSTMAPKKLISA